MEQGTEGGLFRSPRQIWQRRRIFSSAALAHCVYADGWCSSKASEVPWTAGLLLRLCLTQLAHPLGSQNQQVKINYTSTHL